MGPDKNDPRRPIYLACRSLRLLGIVSLAFGALAGMGVLMMFLVPSGGPPTTGLIFFASVVAIYLALGVALLLCVGGLKRGSRGWAITGITLSGIFIVCAALVAFGAATSLYMRGWNSYVNVELIIALLFILAFVQLIFHLAQSMKVLHLVGGYQARGFEVQVAQPHIAPPQVAQPVAQPAAPIAPPPPMVMPPRPKL